MMTFEDIVDMDWLDSHSVKGEPMDLFPNDYVDYNHYLNADLLSPKLEHASSPPPLLLASSPPPTSSSSMFHPVSAASCSAAAALAAATTTPPPPLTFPTTEQIKQLIELAKHQLALRAAQTSNNNSNSNNNNNSSNNNNNNNNNNTNTNNDTTDNSTTPTPSAPNTSTDDKVVFSASINSAPAAAITTHHQHVSPTSPSTTSQLAAHLANTSLFGNDNNNNLPDTVSPESLMKTTVPPPLTIPSKLKKQPSSSITSLSNLKAIKIEQDTTMSTSLLSPPSMDEEEEEIHNNKKPSMSSRRSSLLADEVKSLEAYAESDGIDIKKLTPRERRQLRNKISARNFRVRRKEYITTLEQQVNDHKKHAENLAEQLGKVEHENNQLRDEMDILKRQNLLLQQQHLQVC